MLVVTINNTLVATIINILIATIIDILIVTIINTLVVTIINTLIVLTYITIVTILIIRFNRLLTIDGMHLSTQLLILHVQPQAVPALDHRKMTTDPLYFVTPCRPTCSDVVSIKNIYGWCISCVVLVLYI